jgi:DNA-binding response OmpR family regulator
MKKKNILLVEDDEFLQTLYSNLLKENYSLEVASNGDEAYVKMQNKDLDLILLDIILPKMSGVDVVEKLKIEHPEVLKKHIIFLTNLDRDEMVQKVTKLGYSYLIKSDLNPDEFLEKVKKALS